MRGYDEFNYPMFDRVRDLLEAVGWRVISPADIDRRYPFPLPPEGETIPVEPYMYRDINVIMGLDPATDVVFVLPGWEKSTGAKAEVALAQWRKIPVRMVFLGTREAATIGGIEVFDVRG